jgi:Mn2+/Fe2+ NRAMP family transporter
LAKSNNGGNGAHRNKAVEISLGIVTSIGGFLDAGAIATAAQAGARFRYQLVWATLAGTICVIFLMEMAGRLAAVSKHPLRELLHQRFGSPYSLSLLGMNTVLNVLVLGSEIGGICKALELLSGLSFRWWAVPVTLAVWWSLWRGTFSLLEKAISFAGLVTLAFVVCAFRVHPAFRDVAAGALPSLPTHHAANYWYTAVSIIGAIITPCMIVFYSSGVIEDKWDEGYIGVNGGVAGLGMSFGSAIALGVMIVAGTTLARHGIRANNYGEAAQMMTPVWGWWGFFLFAVSLGIASFGAAVEVSLGTAYEIAQCLGWNWGESQRPRDAARFSLAYSFMLVVGLALVLSGIDPMKLTVFTMALACVTLPFLTFPFLILMNDTRFLGRHTNRRWSNIAIASIIGIAFILAIVALPLQFLGG